jgi:cytochrome b involved in lipid metabolism
MLKQHNKKDDAWTAISGKVYNVTPYLPYHPGGEKELMRVAGRDGTKLFGEQFREAVTPQPYSYILQPSPMLGYLQK